MRQAAWSWTTTSRTASRAWREPWRPSRPCTPVTAWGYALTGIVVMILRTAPCRHHLNTHGAGMGGLTQQRWQKLLRSPCLAPMFSQARHGAADPGWPLAQPPLQRSFGTGGPGNGPRSPELNRSDGVVLDRSLGSQWPFALATCGVALPGDSESTVSSVVARRGSPLVVVGLTHMAPG